MLKRKIVFCTLLISLVLIISTGFASNKEDKKLHSKNTMVITTNSNEDYSKSSFSEDTVSSVKNEVRHMSLYLRDTDRDRVNGPLANRLDIIQNGYTLMRIYGLESYSSDGKYKYSAYDKDERIKYGETDRITYDFARNFEVLNGTNEVDLVLYNNDKEVLRLNDYEIEVYNDMVIEYVDDTYLGLDTLSPKFYIEVINGESAQNLENLDVEFLDSNGDSVGNTQIENADYDGNYFQVKWDIQEEPELFKDYRICVKNGGKEVDIINEWCKSVSFTNQIEINSWGYRNSGDNYEVIAYGLNLKLAEPCSAVFSQNGKSETVENIKCEQDDWDGRFEFRIKVPDVVKNKEEVFEVKLYDKNGNLLDEEEFNNHTSHNDKPDEVPYDHTRFATAFNVSKNKIWTVTFSGTIDESTIDSHIYVLNDKGQKVDILLNLIDSKTVEVIPDGEYKENVLYSLWIEGVKSTKNTVTKKAGIDFVVE